jgi:mRNA-degrading endonuclease HigB of HigAB toxin-antitoxin module
MKTCVHSWRYLTEIPSQWKIFQTNVVEKIKTHFGFNHFFLYENRAVYEIMWENVLRPVSPQMTIRLVRIACRITKATDTHSEYVILTAFHYNSGCTFASKCYVIHTLPIWLRRNVSPTKPPDLYWGPINLLLHRYWGSLPDRVDCPGHFHLVSK